MREVRKTKMTHKTFESMLEKPIKEGCEHTRTFCGIDYCSIESRECPKYGSKVTLQGVLGGGEIYRCEND